MNSLLKNGLHCRKWAEMLGYGTKCRNERDEMQYISVNKLDFATNNPIFRMKALSNLYLEWDEIAFQKDPSPKNQISRSKTSSTTPLGIWG